MLPSTPLPTAPPDPVGPVTRSVLHGIVVGVIGLSTWALATGEPSLRLALAVGLASGLAGGIGWGLIRRQLER